MLDNVKNYYGKVLKTSEDLQTNACCTDDQLPTFVKEALSKIHDEVMTRYYGCGLVVPEELNGCSILDLGSGSGRDCYALAQMVGEQGSVLGIDMTDEQLEVAHQYLDYHQEKFGYQKSNVSFKKGYIEKLDGLNLEDNSFDIIVSNCVINLSTDKKAVLEQAYRLLNPGGELYFSDVYSDKRVPQHLVEDPLLYGECLSGALYYNDFINLSKSVGFTDPRLVNSRSISIGNPEIIKKVDGINFYSITYRLFKLPELEESNEDYGLSVIYQGSIEYLPEGFNLDTDYQFIKDKETTVCGNTWKILQQSRFAKHFKFIGNFDTHHGTYQSEKKDTSSIGHASKTSCSVPSEKASNSESGCC